MQPQFTPSAVLCACGCGGLLTPKKSYEHPGVTRFLKGHYASQRVPITERFWNLVNKTDSCWLWTGCKNSDGYGLVRGVRRGVGATLLAHRASWEIHFGLIPDGMCVLHRCDRPACTRPDHLFLGSPADNATDREAKGRGNQPRGEAHNRAKLTDNQVVEMRRLYAEGGQSYDSIGHLYGVSHSTVSDVINRHHWKHV